MSDIIIGLDTLEGVDMVRFQKADRTGYAGFWDPNEWSKTGGWSQWTGDKVYTRGEPYPINTDMLLIIPFSDLPSGNVPVMIAPFLHYYVTIFGQGWGPNDQPYVLRMSDLDANNHWQDENGDLTVDIEPYNGTRAVIVKFSLDHYATRIFDTFSSVETITFGSRMMRLIVFSGKDPNPS